MAGSGRPPPPLSVVVPGGQTATEVLESGPRERPLSLPVRLRVLLLAVVAVLSTGVLVAVDHPEPGRPSPAAVDDAPAALGVSAQVGLVAEEPFSTWLDVAVTISPGDHGADGRAEPRAPQLKLLRVDGEGLAVRLVRRSPPLLLGYLGRFAGATQRVLHLHAEAVVADCRGRPAPAVRLVVQRADGPLGTVRALGDPSAARALASLVRRTCRLSRG